MVASAKPFLPGLRSPRRELALPERGPFGGGGAAWAPGYTGLRLSARAQIRHPRSTRPVARERARRCRLPEPTEPCGLSGCRARAGRGSVPAGNDRFERSDDRAVGLMSGRGLYDFAVAVRFAALPAAVRHLLSRGGAL